MIVTNYSHYCTNIEIYFTMDAICTSISTFIFGFVINKLRTYAAKKLEDGGLTDRAFRKCFVREFDEVLFQLRTVSNTELSTSISHLKQGVGRLRMAYGKCFNRYLGRG